MSAPTHGMNVDEVQRLGADLQRSADELRQVVQRINGLVQGVTWVGPDAARFKNEWWPGHQSRVAAVAGDLHGFGQSAMHNASEQVNASGGTDGSGATVAVRQTEEPHRAGASGAASADIPSDRYAGFFSDGAKWTNDWNQQASGYDQWNMGYDDNGTGGFGNCTSFVAWRLNQLGTAAGNESYWFDNNKVVLADGSTTDFGRLGNAHEWYGNAPASMRSSDASIGSVLVWERGDGMAMRSGEDYGHVAMVKAVHGDGSITIEESSWDSTTYRERTLAAGTFPSKFLQFLP